MRAFAVVKPYITIAACHVPAAIDLAGRHERVAAFGL